MNTEEELNRQSFVIVLIIFAVFAITLLLLMMVNR